MFAGDSEKIAERVENAAALLTARRVLGRDGLAARAEVELDRKPATLRTLLRIREDERAAMVAGP